MKKLEYERQRRLDMTYRFKELHDLLVEAGEKGARSSSQAVILATAIRFVRRTLDEKRLVPSPTQEEEEAEEEEMSYVYFQSPEVTAFFNQ